MITFKDYFTPTAKNSKEFEDQVNAIKEVTKDDPKMQAMCIKIMEIERDYPSDEKTRLSMLDDLIKKSVEEDVQ